MRLKLLLKIGAGVIALLVLVLVAFNLLISADAVRDRVAARVKEQTGRELTVNGSTSLLLMPSPHIVLTDVEIVDPENRAGADLKVARLALDVTFGQTVQPRGRRQARGHGEPGVHRPAQTTSRRRGAAGRCGVAAGEACRGAAPHHCRRGRLRRHAPRHHA